MLLTNISHTEEVIIPSHARDLAWTIEMISDLRLVEPPKDVTELRLWPKKLPG